MKKLHFWEAVATLTGTIIGAGVLGIPYAVSKVGIIWGGIFLLVLGLAVMMVHLMVAEMLLRTKEEHQVAGCIARYVGHGWQYLEYFALLIKNYGAMLAYVIGAGTVLAALFGGSVNFYSIIFWLVGAIILYFGLSWIKIFELIMLAVIIIVLLVISGVSAPVVDVANFMSGFEWSGLFVLYGVILFAYGGVGAIFSVKKILQKDKHLIKHAVILGSAIPMVLYALFALVVVGVTGVNSTQIATVGLGEAVGPGIVLLGSIFAFFALGTSFLTIGLGLKQVIHYDWYVGRKGAWLLTVLVPIAFFLLGVTNFIAILSILGGFTVGISGILIVLAYRKAKKKGDQRPVFVIPRSLLIEALLFVMFLVGVLYSFVDFKNLF